MARFLNFAIKNYKGIDDATLKLDSPKGSVHTLVGLNESGKTTLLEALNSFNYDFKGVHALAQGDAVVQGFGALIPKKHKHNFTGEITVSSDVLLDEGDVEGLKQKWLERGLTITSGLNPIINISRSIEFKNSRFESTIKYWNFHPTIKRRGKKKEEVIEAASDDWQKMTDDIEALFPRVIYFPTFLFNFPERIQLHPVADESESDGYFRQVIEDAFASLGGGMKLGSHVVDRIVNRLPSTSYNFWTQSWTGSEEREAVVSSLNRLARHLTKEIFGRWQEVLGSKAASKELIIEHFVEPGDGLERKIFLNFRIRDGESDYKLSERSLGFQWFFCFLLFTRFFRGNERGETVFLFDEPASNLHSRAQVKLLESLKLIAGNKNYVIYSTHSHHMINPLWLETAHIVTNGPLKERTLQDDLEALPEDISIRVEKYKTFVGKNAEKSYYFQPILERLQVAPSLLEVGKAGVLVEGKSDFYILNWYKHSHPERCRLNFLPVGGAGNAASLISLYLGIGGSFALLLDADNEGGDQRKRYLDNLPLREDGVVSIASAVAGKKEIEDLISSNMKRQIGAMYSAAKVTKKIIMRAFADALAAPEMLVGDEETFSNLHLLVDSLRAAIEKAGGRVS